MIGQRLGSVGCSVGWTAGETQCQGLPDIPPLGLCLPRSTVHCPVPLSHTWPPLPDPRPAPRPLTLSCLSPAPSPTRSQCHLLPSAPAHLDSGCFSSVGTAEVAPRRPHQLVLCTCPWTAGHGRAHKQYQNYNSGPSRAGLSPSWLASMEPSLLSSLFPVLSYEFPGLGTSRGWETFPVLLTFCLHVPTYGRELTHTNSPQTLPSPPCSRPGPLPRLTLLHVLPVSFPLLPHPPVPLVLSSSPDANKQHPPGT